MRFLPMLLAGFVLAGCGSSGSASGPTPKPTGPPSWPSAPPMTINPSKHYAATMVTDAGSFTVTLLSRVAPITVNNFVFLARHHFYHHVLIHRIIKDFMFQTGDPTGTGAGGPGYTIQDEKVTMPYTLGTLAMANTGAPNSGSSQFFVVLVKRWVPPKPIYTIFGKVSSGLDVVAKIANTPVQVNPGTNELSQPVNDIYLNDVTIHES